MKHIQRYSMKKHIINEDNVTTPYDKTVDMTDTYDNNGNLIDPKFNSDIPGYEGGDRFWITTKLDVYAKWRSTLDGAAGIHVEYDDGAGTGAPTDNTVYVDSAYAPAGAASIPPSGSNTVFGYWVAQKWNKTESKWEDTSVTVYPGGTFQVLAANAKVERHCSYRALRRYQEIYCTSLRELSILNQRSLHLHIFTGTRIQERKRFRKILILV